MKSTRCGFSGLGVVMLAITVTWGWAQEPAASVSDAPAVKKEVPAAAVDPAAERAQLENIVKISTKELDRAHKRVQQLTDQLVTLDDDIESRVSRIVSLLSAVRDTTDESSLRLLRLKEDILEGLKATALYYAQERDRRKKEMANPRARIDDAELARNIDRLNERIEVRVTQSLEIASSLMTYQESSASRYQDEEENDVESREFRNSERAAESSVKVKADVSEVLKKSVEKLTRDIKAREEELATAGDPVRQEQLRADIATMRQQVDTRREQLEALIMRGGAPADGLSKRGAFEVEELVEDMATELKSDFSKFKTLVRERDAAVARLSPLEKRLTKAKGYIAEMDAEDAGQAPAGATLATEPATDTATEADTAEPAP